MPVDDECGESSLCAAMTPTVTPPIRITTIAAMTHGNHGRRRGSASGGEGSRVSVVMWTSSAALARHPQGRTSLRSGERTRSDCPFGRDIARSETRTDSAGMIAVDGHAGVAQVLRHGCLGPTWPRMPPQAKAIGGAAPRRAAPLEGVRVAGEVSGGRTRQSTLRLRRCTNQFRWSVTSSSEFRWSRPSSRRVGGSPER